MHEYENNEKWAVCLSQSGKENPAVVRHVDITTNIAAGDQLEIGTLTNNSGSPHNSIHVAFIAVLTCWSSTSSINQPDAPQL